MVLKKIAIKMLFRPIFLAVLFAGLQPCGQAQSVPGYQSGQNQNFNNTNNYGINNSPYASLETSNTGGFWNGLNRLLNKNQINDGTVFTGVLQEDISSKKSKAGDVFSIMLPENYTVSDRVLIPQYSKFVGTVLSAAPATKAHMGNPGNLQVSIQTLVSPDGTSIPVNVSIDYNPNQTSKADIKKSRGVPLGEWGQSIGYSVLYYGGSLGSRMGVPFLYKGQTKGGQDFSLSKGELIPLRLTQPLDVTPILSSKRQMFTPNSAPLVPTQVNQNNNSIVPSNIPNGLNMMPDTTKQAGPEPF